MQERGKRQNCCRVRGIFMKKFEKEAYGYIKDMLKDFLPIENSDDWIMSILSNNIKVDKDGEETLEICGVMG